MYRYLTSLLFGVFASAALIVVGATSMTGLAYADHKTGHGLPNGTQLSDLDCVSSEVPQWNGSVWGCSLEVGPQGEQGEQGIQGETGLKGDQGIQGETGLKGDQGIAGTNGAGGVDCGGRSARRVIVNNGVGGGDFTTITEALDDAVLVAGEEPTYADPLLIDVRPGTYVETVALISHVCLRGAGRSQTILMASVAPSCPSGLVDECAIFLEALEDVEISGLKIEGSGGDSAGILDLASSPTITNNLITNLWSHGIYSKGSSPKITENDISDNQISGIYLSGSTAKIVGNDFSVNGGVGISCAIFIGSSAVHVLSNQFSNNGKGVCSDFETDGFATSTGTIAENLFVNNETAAISNSHPTSTLHITANRFECDPSMLSTGVFNSSGSATIVGNSFEGCSRSAVLLDSGDAPVSVVGNVIKASGSTGFAAIRTIDSSAAINGNTIIDSVEDGIATIGSGAAVINGNLIQSSGQYGIELGSSGHPNVLGNTFVDHGSFAINGTGVVPFFVGHNIEY